MEFKFRAVDDRPPPYMSPSATLGYFPDLAFRAGYSHGFDNVQIPIDTREAIYLREMEKQRIREDIIAEEITRRRVLEAEVRRELMVEREMAMRRAAEMGLPYEEIFSMQSDSRLSYMDHFDNRWFEDQRAYTSRGGLGCSHDLLPQPEPPLRMPEPPCDEVKASRCKKDKFIMLARPDPNLAGKKRKMPPESGVHTLPLASSKKPKEEWSCALCQVSATSEKGLNEHLQGRKHKAKEEELRAQRMAKTSQTRPLPKKTGKHSWVAKTSVSASSETERVEKKSSGIKKTGNESNQKMELKNKDLELPLKKNQGAENFENKNETLRMAPEFKEKKKKNYKEKFKFWCEMCSIGAHSEVVMDAHIEGKKHKIMLEKLDKNGKALLTPISTSIIEETQMAKDENMIENTANKSTKEDIPDADGLCPLEK
ncbi:hypothetical protein SLA2020_176170 [Shorea laevis]